MAPRTELGWKVGVGVGKPRQKRLYRTGSFLLTQPTTSLLKILAASIYIVFIVDVKIFVDKY